MQAEANLYEPPRLALRRFRVGEVALASLFDGIAEARDILRGTIVAFWRKLFPDLVKLDEIRDINN